MNCFSFLVVISGLFCLTVGDELECGPNQIINECGSNCVGEPTCQIQNPTQPNGTACIAMCVRRCECDAENGWIRATSDGPCVNKDACPSAGCGPNEIENECGSNCVGEPTCENQNPTQANGTACIAVCVRRCECDAENGWIRAAPQAPCININSCPAGCPKHEKQDCAPCCPDPTCQKRKPCCPKKVFCPKICRLTCRCEHGFIRDTSTGKCVPTSQCPKPKL